MSLHRFVIWLAVGTAIGGCGTAPSTLTSTPTIAPPPSVELPTSTNPSTTAVAPETSPPTTAPSSSPTTEVIQEAAPSSTTITTTVGEATTPVHLEVPVVWPAAHVIFDDPVDAAADYLGVINSPLYGRPVAPDYTVLGGFHSDGDRAGDIPVHFHGEEWETVAVSERTILKLRQLAPTNGWYIVAALGTSATITLPDAGATVVGGSIEVRGEAQGYESNMTYRVHPAGDRTMSFDSGYTMVGYDEPAPYELQVNLAPVPKGSTVVIHVESDSGIGQGGFSAIPVVVVDEIPATD